ncbi:MAG: hypothetical protein Q9201_000087 [Fulgogasparrea decipioides]
MPDLSILGTLAPYHILTYGTLLGSNVFQSFVNGIVAFRTLPRPQFSSLQTAIFPIYFSIQSALPVLLALTYPGAKSALYGSSSQQAGSLAGFFAEQNRWSVLAPLAACFAINFANLTYLGPKTQEIMRVRKHQETKDGKKCFDPPPHSKEMQRLNKSFGRMHGASAGLNLVSLTLVVWYGVVLAERIQ